MPVYEYRCGCDEVYSIELSVGVYAQATRDGYPRPCPMCQQERKRIFNATPAIFKGSGWAGKDKK